MVGPESCPSNQEHGADFLVTIVENYGCAFAKIKAVPFHGVLLALISYFSSPKSFINGVGSRFYLLVLDTYYST